MIRALIMSGAAFNLLTCDPQPVAQHNLVFVGDSITEGTAVADPTQRYPNLTAAKLNATWTMHNSGHGGFTTTDLIGWAVRDVTPLYDPKKTNVCILLSGTNGLSGTTYSEIQTYAGARRAEGFLVIVSTVMGFRRGTQAAQIQNESDRIALNNSLRAGWQTFADGLADFAVSPMDTIADSDSLTYFSDKVHPTIAGNMLMAAIAYPQIERFE